MSKRNGEESLNYQIEKMDQEHIKKPKRSPESETEKLHLTKEEKKLAETLRKNYEKRHPDEESEEESEKKRNVKKKTNHEYRKKQEENEITAELLRENYEHKQKHSDGNFSPKISKDENTGTKRYNLRKIPSDLNYNEQSEQIEEENEITADLLKNNYEYRQSLQNEKNEDENEITPEVLKKNYEHRHKEYEITPENLKKNYEHGQKHSEDENEITPELLKENYEHRQKDKQQDDEITPELLKKNYEHRQTNSEENFIDLIDLLDTKRVDIEKLSAEQLGRIIQQKKDQLRETEDKKMEEKEEVENESESESKKYSDSVILEKGHIHFFYRPKVDVKEAHSLPAVQRLNVLLIPTEGLMRLLKIPSKILPNIQKHERKLAIVKKVADNIDSIVSELVSKKYETKKREKVIEAARFFASGIYALIRHKDHSHLAYVLEFPQKISDLHQSFNLDHEGSFIVAVKSPNNPTFYKGKSPLYPIHVKKLFKKNKKWCPLTPELVNYPGTEIILIGAKNDQAKELPGTGEYLEDEAEKEAICTNCKELSKSLHLQKQYIPIDPIKGKWL